MNYAFIDAQNLHLGIKEDGWRIDYRAFRKYLKDKYQVEVAYMFIGYMKENEALYTSLRSFGFELVFKEVLVAIDKNGKKLVKGNVDAELVLQALIDIKKYRKAVIVSGDGDFGCLVRYLKDLEKIERVLVPRRENCSLLLRKAAQDKILFMSDLKKKIEKRKTRHR